MKLPISGTGISILDQRQRQKGFTLWELLIVVAIIAITVSIVQLAPSLADKDRDLKKVGKNLGKLFHLLGQEAVFENRNFAVSVHDEGYLVLEYNGEEWLQSEDSFFQKFKLNENQRSLLLIEDIVIDITKSSTPKPHILILSSGEMTPFEWRISDHNSQSGIVLLGSFAGKVLMTGPEPIG